MTANLRLIAGKAKYLKVIIIFNIYLNFRFPGALKSMLRSISRLVVSNDHIRKFSSIVNVLDETDVLTDGDLCIIEQNLNDIIRWKYLNLYKIEYWLKNHNTASI